MIQSETKIEIQVHDPFAEETESVRVSEVKSHFSVGLLGTLNKEIRRKKSSFHPDDYFDDGKRQIDLILVWKKYPEGKNKDGSPVDLEKFQKRNAQREALFLEVSKNLLNP